VGGGEGGAEELPSVNPTTGEEAEGQRGSGQGGGDGFITVEEF